MKQLKIFLTGRDYAHWALDTEYALTRQALSTFAEIVPHPATADLIHSVNIDETADLIRLGHMVPCIPVVGSINNHPSRLIELPYFVEAIRRFIFPIPLTDIAARDMDRLGIPYVGRASIAADFTSYRPIAQDDAGLQELRRKIGLPVDRYVIGLLQRDSDGRDLGRPKIQKGADVFVALMMILKRKLGSNKFHVLLGGPRRHWIRQELEKQQIPYSFVGDRVDGDDFPLNVLDKKTVCLLYNLLDLYIIPTRWEGAPRQLFDMICCRRKIISTCVGIVPEVLPAECCFRDLDEALEIVLRDMETNHLASFIDPARRLLDKRHTIEAVGKIWQDIYARIVERGVVKPLVRRSKVLRYVSAAARLGLIRTSRKITSRLFRRAADSVLAFECSDAVLDRQGSIFALKTALIRGGFNLRKRYDAACDVIMIHDSALGQDRLSQLSKGDKRMIHVIDEPSAAAIAGTGEDSRQRFVSLQSISTATLLTSDYSLEFLAKASVSPKNPWVVKIPPDSVLFCRGPECKGVIRSPLRIVVLAYGSTLDKLSLLPCLTGNSAYAVTVVSDREIPEITGPVILNPNADARARLAHESHIVVALPQIIESHYLLEYLACGLPVILHEKLIRYRSTIGMGGLTFSGADALRHAVSVVAADRKAFSMAACVPRMDEGLDGIRRFIAES